MTNRIAYHCITCKKDIPLGDLKVSEADTEYPKWLLCPGCNDKVMTQQQLLDSGWDYYEDVLAKSEEWDEEWDEDDDIDNWTEDIL